MKNIVNIINFVRGIEPRPRDTDLHKPVIEQIRLMRENDLRGTFLLQYDAFIDDSFLKLMDDCKDFCEIGLWFEVVQPLVENIGEKWNGRYSWDWYNDVGFLIGYDPSVRFRLIDAAMDKFKEIFGYYPKSVGSWHIDAQSMEYLDKKYNISAMCICRDQVGTDGYTMQGGYYNQAYYPSKYNMFCPASNEENQVNVPVFRMLGTDPIYEYDRQVVDYGVKKCCTLEPAMKEGYTEWATWYLDEIYDGSGISFQYTQAGQENSFGWPRMGKNLEFLFPHIKKLADEGKFEIMTLEESGEWYKQNYKTTPPAVIKSLTDWSNDKYKSVWYYSNKYRANLFWDDGVVKIRDMYIFDDRYKEHYYDKKCTTSACEFRNLPVMDATIYNSKEKSAGIYFTDGKNDIVFNNLTYTEKGDTATVVLSNGDAHATVTFDKSTVSIKSNIKNLTLVPCYDKDKVYGKKSLDFGNHNNSNTNLTFISDAKCENNTLAMTFNGFDYSLKVTCGTLTDDFKVVSDNGNITANV